ncbi:hypothetical protein [Salinisphaera sp. G21_0]
MQDFQIKIRTAHFPAYCSKYNPIEHRAFRMLPERAKALRLSQSTLQNTTWRKLRLPSGHLWIRFRLMVNLYRVGVEPTGFKRMISVHRTSHILRRHLSQSRPNGMVRPAPKTASNEPK